MVTFDEHGWMVGELPAECIKDCSSQGSVDEAVEYWRNELGFAAALEPIRPKVEAFLKGYGAWDDLATADMDTLADRVLWMACCDLKEQGEWFGLV